METPTQDMDVRWLYTQSQLKLREILPTNKTFDVIQISELVDPTDFISPNSVVLSVGIAFAETPDGLRDWAHRLAAAGVVAIGSAPASPSHRFRRRLSTPPSTLASASLKSPVKFHLSRSPPACVMSKPAVPAACNKNSSWNRNDLTPSPSPVASKPCAVLPPTIWVVQ